MSHPLRCLLAGLLLFPLLPSRGEAQAAPADSGLVQAILRQDSLLFHAFNACDTLALARAFAADLEFYHDRTGLTVGSQANVAPIADRRRRMARGEAPTLRRDRLPESDAVYSVPGLGAIQLGRHRFTQGAFRGQPASEAVFGFAEVWRQHDSTWQLIRVLSFDH